MRGTKIIGHRGFAARFPDNALAGVRAAFEVGADGVEIDVRPAATGTWVCHHDRTRRGRAISTWRLSELRREGVPTLEEVVAVAPSNRWLFVEVKPLAARELERSLVGLVTPLRERARHVRVISSSLPVLAAVQTMLAYARFAWVFGSLPEWLPEGVELSPRHDLVERLLDQGRPLHPWTVNRPERMRALAALGVASITTNYPDLAVEVLRG
jgi:glycerophosphoryl diester phosphodiesterase